MSSNTLTYNIVLNDRLSSAMNRVNSVMNAMRGTMNRVQNQVSGFQNSMNQAARSVDSFNRQISTGLNKSFRDAFNQIPFANLLTNPLVLAGATAGRAISLGIKDEMTRVSMETLLGDANVAKSLYDQIAEYGKTSPYEKLNLADNVKMMLGFGIQQEKVIQNMKMLGDVAMGDSNKMNLLTLAFSQVASAGKLQGQDLLQMINAGFNPLQAISESTGKSMADLRKEMSAGNISFSMVEDAFKKVTNEGGRFYNMSDKMGQTLGGRLSTLMDTLNESLLKLYNVLAPILIPAVNTLIVFIDALANSFQGLIDWFNSGSVGLYALEIAISAVVGAWAVFTAYAKINAIWGAVTTFWALAMEFGFWGTAKALWGLNSAMFANPAFWVVTGIMALVAAVVIAWNKFEGFRKFMYSLWETIKQVFSNIGDFFKAIFAPIGEAIDGIKNGDFGKVATAVAKLNPIGMAYQAVKFGMDGGFTKGVSEAWDRGQKMGTAQKAVSNATNKPGSNNQGSVGVGGAKGDTKTNNSLGTNRANTITSGGKSSNNTYINLRNLVEHINIYANTKKEAMTNMEDEVVKALSRVLNTANNG